ncbi:MAG: hypothetical protein K9M95_07500 [Candidatus Cloacimonetes bacterium]|nr:hypothetical protein [Candidatus Cloacimonadota bacterium]MCF7813948.1 hypothetical protein [Candidatus Cloacimonadota bacterium]MCF7883962.1 hypothetical protein [Candidatus Cloacimonadota bacterium]
MAFLKPVFIILWNMLPGFLVTYLIKQALFFPDKEKRFPNGKKVPLTPGFAYKAKNYLIHRITRLVQDFINDSRNNDSESRISKWENDMFHKAWNKFEPIENIKILPHKWKENIRFFFASIIYQLTKQFLRSFVPYLMEHYEVEKYIELIDKKIDMDIIKHYYERYIYRYVMYVVLAIGFVVGLWNVIIYLIVK